MTRKLYEDVSIIQYDDSPVLNGNIANKAIHAALKAIACELPKETHTPSNFKGILKDCENLIDNAGLIKDGISDTTGLKYPLLSEAMASGLYHPNCKDSHTTYFEGINTAPEGSEYTTDELNDIADKYAAEQKQRHAENQAEKYDRLAKYSLDSDNKRIYSNRAQQWREKAETIAKRVENSDEDGIIEARETLI